METNGDSTRANAPWQFDWWHIFKASRQACQPAKLFLAAAGLMLTFVVGHALDRAWLGMGWGIEAATLQASPMMVRVAPDPDQTSFGLFAVLTEHEKHCLDQALKAARKLELTSGMGDVWSRLDQPGYAQGLPTVGDGFGVFAFVVAMGKGLWWMLTHNWHHWLYMTIMLALALTIWSLFGGAICRASAVHFALDERLSSSEALRYSRDKFGAFFAAPLVPAIFILVTGLFLLVGGWAMLIPGIGPTVGGLIFGLALIGGAVIALFLIGTLAGFSLMWPTVAVEGLDFTDAVSRSISYFYERLERTVLYALLAIIYGAVVWLFVRFFVLVLAHATHGFVSAGYAPLEQMWQAPSYDNLYSVVDSGQEIEGWADRNLAFPLIRAWVTVGGFLLYGYLISYYFTGSTIIYLLLRRHVDETDLDDIYVEPAAESPPAPQSEESTGN